jgi:hypothetical protein
MKKRKKMVLRQAQGTLRQAQAAIKFAVIKAK